MAGIAAIIVLAGIYWPESGTDTDEVKRTDQEQTFETADIDERDWDISEEASLDLQEGDETAQEETDPYNRFSIPGQVIFPTDVTPQKVDLEVDIQLLKPENAEELAQRQNPIKYMLGQGGEDSFEQETITRTITTDEDGKFEITNAPPGLYGVTTADTAWSAKNRVQKIQAAAAVQPMKLEIARTSGLIGTVVDSDSNPIDSARVEYTTKDESIAVGRDGQFKLGTLEPNERIDHFKILKEGYEPYYFDESPLKPGELRRDTFVLQRGAQLRVKVRDTNGDPIRQGHLILNRADDLEITSQQHLAAAHGGAKMASLQGEGQYTFANLRPGKVHVALRSSQFIPESRTVTVEPGGLSEITLTVRKGEPLNISLINESNGEPVTSIQPQLQVFDSDGNRLKPGYTIDTINDEGTIKAFLHPETDRFKIRARSSIGRFKTKVKEFSANDLPDVELVLVPADTPEDDQPQTPPGLLSVETEGSVDWSSVTKGQVYVLDKKSGQRVRGQAGSGNVLSEPIPLDLGEYLLYGVFERSESPSLGFVQEVTIESKRPGKQPVEVRETGRVSGTVTGLESQQYQKLKVGISLLPGGSGSDGSAPRSVYYPGAISTTPASDGSFTIENVPAGSNLSLHVLAKSGAQLDVEKGSVLATKSLPQLGPGESRDVSVIDLGE